MCFNISSAGVSATILGGDCIVFDITTSSPDALLKRHSLLVHYITFLNKLSKIKHMELLRATDKGVICENWPPVELILKTSSGLFFTRVTANCCC